MTEVETSIIKRGGSWYVLIPKDLANGFGLDKLSEKHFDGKKEKAKIKDVKNKAIITFPVW